VVGSRAVRALAPPRESETRESDAEQSESRRLRDGRYDQAVKEHRPRVIAAGIQEIKGHAAIERRQCSWQIVACQEVTDWVGCTLTLYPEEANVAQSVIADRKSSDIALRRSRRTESWVRIQRQEINVG
jgi:hypothetical protein